MTLFVNGEQVESNLIEREIDRLRPDYERTFADMDAQQREEQLVKWSKENVIEQVIIVQEAKKLTGDFSAQVKHRYDELMGKGGGEEKFYADRGLDIAAKPDLEADLETQIKVTSLIGKIADKVAKPTVAEIQKFYTDNKERFTIPEMVRASHIVKHIAPDQENPDIFEQMQKAAAAIAGGEKFEDVVVKYSDCASNGGDLGYFARGKMVEEFEDAAFDSEIGDVSPIFRTEFGYHIVKVTDKKPARECGIDEVSEYIVKQLEEKAREKAVEKFLDEKMNKAVIKEV